jgi:predicted O-methyltransferase YrrM
MSDPWTAIDHFFDAKTSKADGALENALRTAAEAEIPAINVAPNQGKLLQLLARGIGATRILEIGTLAGYSTIWLARALPEGGSLITLEFNPLHAEVAMANIDYAGLADIVQVRQGAAIDHLPDLVAEGLAFDFVFIDADKRSVPAYFEWAIKLTRPGGMIIVDNVVRGGAILDAKTEDPDVRGIQQFFDSLAEDSRVSVTAIQTVGSKGYDGFALALVN